MDKNKLGFTLVEMLVVTVIVIALMGATLTQYNTFTQQKKLSGETKKLFEFMSLASKRAYTGDSGTSCTDFQGFQVNVVVNNVYNMKLCCESACNSAQSTTVTSYTLPTGIVFTAPAANTTYLFNKLNQSVSIAPAGNQTLTLKNTVTSKCISITVNPSGLLSQGTDIGC